MSFTGEFRHTIDAKGRLIVPSRMRDELGEGQVVLTRWLDDCIAIWSQEGWLEMETKLRRKRPQQVDPAAVVVPAGPTSVPLEGATR